MTDKKIVRDFIHACSAGHHGLVFAFSRMSKLAVKEYKRFAKE